MDKATPLPLRGSLGRKPVRATQEKIRARKEGKEQKKMTEENAKNEEKIELKIIAWKVVYLVWAALAIV